MSKGVYQHKKYQGFQKGYKNSPEVLTKFSELRKGKPRIGKLTEDSKERIRQSRLGKRNSIKTEFKKGHIGYKANWKGGITPIMLQIRHCFKYRQWRSDVFTRDNFTCQECGKKQCYLEAHHIKRFNKIIEEYKIKTLEQALNCEELWNINNGITLCRKCHDKNKKAEILNKINGN